MNKNNGNFKKLIRNLRTKKYEKLHFVRNNAIVSQREKSQDDKPRQN